MTCCVHDMLCTCCVHELLPLPEPSTTTSHPHSCSRATAAPQPQAPCSSSAASTRTSFLAHVPLSPPFHHSLRNLHLYDPLPPPPAPMLCHPHFILAAESLPRACQSHGLSEPPTKMDPLLTFCKPSISLPCPEQLNLP